MRQVLLIVFFSLSVIAGLLVVASEQKAIAPAVELTQEDNQPDDNANEPSNQEPVQSVAIEDLDLANFSDNQLRDLYNSLNFPGTVEIVERPEITGNDLVDDFIAERAEKRGYEIREIPKTELVEFEGLSVQPKLLDSWLKLIDQAKAEGLGIEIVSAYRSIEEQRKLFIDRMNTFGVDYSSVQTIDVAALDRALSQVAPPGYSRHHNGYTIDLASPGYSVFEYSPAYTWLTKNNYEIIKKHGFIPSYPKEATFQGPNPEAWEYVWSDRYNLVQR